VSYFAESIKNLRLEQNLTMQALADKADVSKSMICKIESDKVQPTLDVAARISRALGKNLSEMLHAPQNTAVVFLKKDQQAVWEDALHIKRRNISPVFEGLKLEWLHITIPANTNIEKCMAIAVPGVEKYLLVVKGKLEVSVGPEIYFLQEGESLYFDCAAPHKYFNKHDEPVEFYAVVKH
jgi:transcriptional regulator with XRE-family HTH domain